MVLLGKKMGDDRQLPVAPAVQEVLHSVTALGTPLCFPFSLGAQADCFLGC